MQFTVTTTISFFILINEPTPGWPPSFCLYARALGLLTDDPNYLNENNALLIPFLRNLGKAVLRIGGNSGDELAVEATMLAPIRSTVNSLTPISTGCWFEKAIN